MRKKMRLIAALLLAAFLLALPALALSPGTAKVTASALRFRSEPSLEGEILGLAVKGTVVEVLEDQGEWSRVRWNGEEGYMATRYLEQLTVSEPEDLAEQVCNLIRRMAKRDPAVGKAINVYMISK